MTGPSPTPRHAHLVPWLCGGILAAGLGLSGAAAGYTAGRGQLWAHPLAYLAVAVIVVGLLSWPHRIVHGRASESIELDEVLFVPMTLVFSGTQVVLAFAIGFTIAQLVNRRPLVKAAFNIGQGTLATGVGVLLVHIFASPGAALGHKVYVAVVAGFCFAFVSAAAVAMIIAVASGELFQAVLFANWRTRLLAWTGSLSLGALTTLTAVPDPTLLPLSLAPAVFVQAAYAAALSDWQQRIRAEALHRGTRAVRTSTDPATVREHTVTAALEALAAGEAALVDPTVPVPDGALRAPLSDTLALEVSARVAGRGWTADDTVVLESLAGVAADALRHAELFSRLRAVTDGQGEGVIAVDADGVVTFANPAARQMLRTDGEVEGRPSAQVFTLDAGGRPDALTLSLQTGATQRDDDCTLLTCDGMSTPVAVTASALAGTEEGGAVLVLRDISERKVFEQQLSHQAFHDQLTGLPNRRLLFDRVEHALARSRRADGQHALLFLDLDRFKLVNDSYGHLVGDELLTAVVGRLQGCLRPEDTLARFGGDEFVVLLEDIGSQAEAEETGARMLASLTAPFVVGGHEVFAAASIGIALSTPDQTRERLLADADAAANRAKARGKNQVAVYEPGSVDEAREALALESALRRALDRGEFVLHYQPIVDTVTGETSGVEALVRWNHPEQGMVPPFKFIPLAEETGLILPLGAWVLRTACAQTMVWTQQNRRRDPPVVSVNLSPRQFRNNAIVAEVATVLAETGLDPAQLCLEITETVVMEDTGATLATLRELKALGVKVAIDDFGTGYSSLSYLKRFPVDKVKVDRAFITGLTGDNVDSEIVAAVIRLAAAIGIDVVAEGVETIEQRQILARLGCSEIQGYLIARPQPAEEVASMWRTGGEPLGNGRRL